MIFNLLNLFTFHKYIYSNAIINKVFQTKKFYSSYNVFSITPVISYLNAELEKDIIIKQNKNKSGIYLWINVINNKKYIGSSIDLSRRFKEYYNKNYISKVKRNFPIHAALLKYDYSNFKLEILEYCDKFNLREREQYYMDILKPEYNVLKIAGSRLGFKHNESTKKLFRLTRLGRLFSEATRLKLSANSYKSIPVKLTDIKTGNITKFSSKSKAAKFLGISETTVRNYIKKNKCYKGYTIMIG